jgi:enoyl-CoA hydratase/carnithine racemase
MDQEPLLLQTRDARGVVTLTMNRPQHYNALSEAMLAALQQALDGLAQDEHVRCVVLAGGTLPLVAGPRLVTRVAARRARPIGARLRPGEQQGLGDPFVALADVQRALLQRIGHVHERAAFRTTETKDHRA